MLRLLPLAVGMAAIGPVAAQTTTAPEVVVSGQRVPETQPSPIESIAPDAATMRRTGLDAPSEIIQRLPILGGNSLAEAGLGNDPRAGRSSPSIHTLGSSRTLSLVEGRRILPSSYDSESGNLNGWPFIAIKRYRIEGDGNSARYGPGALAGTVDVQLRPFANEAEATWHSGWTQGGGARYNRVSALYGTVENAPAGTVPHAFQFAVERRTRDGLVSDQRSFARTGDRREVGLDGYSIEGYPGSYFAGRFVPAADCPANRVRFGLVCTYDDAPWNTIYPRVEQTSALLQAQVPLPNGWTGRLRMQAGQDSYLYQIAPQPISDTYSATNTPFFMLPSSRYNPSGDLAFVLGRTEQLGARRVQTDTTQGQLALEASGKWAGWNAQVAAGTGTVRTVERLLSGWVSESAYRTGVLAGRINPLGATAAADMDALLATDVRLNAGIGSLRQNWVETQGSRDFAVGKGSLTLTLGAEWRRQAASQSHDPRINAGDVLSFGPLANASADRSFTALRGEAQWRPDDSVELLAALRHDRVTGTQGFTSPRVAGDWQVAGNVHLTGSWGRSFALPHLREQLYGTRSIGLSSVRDPIRCPATGAFEDCLADIALRAGGNPNLVPEEGIHRTLGVWWQKDDLRLAARHWSVSIENVIYGPGLSSLLSDPLLAARYVQRAASTDGLAGPIQTVDVRVQNVGRQYARGVDLEATGALGKAAGWHWDFTALASYLGRRTLWVYGSDGRIDSAGQYRDAGPLPRWRALLSLTAARGNWEHTLSADYVGSYQDTTATATDQPRDVPSFAGLDWHTLISQPKPGWQLALGVRNLTNRKPPFSRTGYISTGWDAWNHDALGRRFYLALSWRR